MYEAKANLEKVKSKIKVPKIKIKELYFEYKICKDINKKAIHKEYGPEVPTKDVIRLLVLNLP